MADPNDHWYEAVELAFDTEGEDWGYEDDDLYWLIHDEALDDER